VAEISVEVNGDAAVRMLERIREGLRFTQAVYRSAQEGAGMVSDIPRGATGALSGSIRAVRGSSNTTAQIVSDVPYARFVFRGTRHMTARPPDVHADQLARILADEITRDIFK
jgi:hypothetical protein